MIEGALTKLARVLAVRLGLVVNFSRNFGASTDGKTINIMNLSDAKFERIAARLTLKGINLLRVINGFLDHEAAHCYYTFTAHTADQLFEGMKKTASRMVKNLTGFDGLSLKFREKIGTLVLKTLSNFAEDRRIEYRWIIRFPGSEESILEISRFDVALGEDKPTEEAETEIETEAAGIMSFYNEVLYGLFRLSHRPVQAEIYGMALGRKKVTPRAAEFIKRHGLTYEKFVGFETVEELISFLEPATEALMLDIFTRAKAIKEGTPKPEPKPKGKPLPPSDDISSEAGEPEEGDEEGGEEGEDEAEGSSKGSGEETEEEGEENEEEGSTGSEGAEEGEEEGEEEGAGSGGEEDDEEGEDETSPVGGSDEGPREVEGEGTAGECNPNPEPHPEAAEILKELERRMEEAAEDQTKSAMEELQTEADGLNRAVALDETVDPIKAWEPASTRNDRVSPVRGNPLSSVLDGFVKEVSAISVGHVGRKLLGEYRNRFTPASEGTRINLRAMGGFAAGVPDFNRLFIRKENKQSRKGTVVQLVVDLSGSMGGRKMHSAMVSAGVIGDLLQRLSIPFEIIGFTTRGWGSGLTEEGAYVPTPIHGWTRCEALDFQLFKGFNEPMSTATPGLASWVNRAGCNNVDGESVQFCANRLLARPEARKIMVVLSDGLPAFEGADQFKANAHLKAVCKKLEETPGLELYGIGIRSEAVKKFYSRYVILWEPTELPSVLGKLFSGDNRGFTTHSERKAASY